MAEPVRTAIFTILQEDATLTALLADGADGIYHRTAPQDAHFPMVILFKQSGAPQYAFGSAPEVSHYFDSELWTVKAVAREDSATAADDINARCQELLQDAPLAITGYGLMMFHREEDVDFGEIEIGEMLHHCGAMYRLMKQPL